MRRLICAAALAISIVIPSPGPAASPASKSALDNSPLALEPTPGTSLAELLRRHTDALGRLRPGTTNTRRETWTLDEAGLRGTETIVRLGLDYKSHIECGPLVEEHGQRGERKWHRGPNGTISPTESEEGESFIMLRVEEDASDAKNDVRLAGLAQTPKPAYVVEVKTPGQTHPEWISFDRDSALIVRVDRVNDDGDRLTTTYDDYRTTDGLTEPWHVHDDLPAMGVGDDFVRTALALGGPVEPSELGEGSDSFRPASYAGVVSLPAHMRYGTTIVRLVVNGRGLDFELASGEPRSLIDQNIAQQLNLPTFGKTTRAKNGDRLGYDTIIADASVGDLKLHDFAVHAVPFTYDISQDTKVVGLLGYDFLRSGLIKIDYVNGRVLLYDPATSAIPTKEGETVLPIRFDDGLPLAHGKIGGHVTKSILIDNSYPFSFVMGSFANQHPEAVPDRQGQHHGRTVVPFADANGYGREVDVWRAKVPSLDLGDTEFRDLDMIGVNANFPFARDVDAIVGAELLVFFDIWLDYSNNRIVLQPNEDFKKQFRSSKI
jgi:hypothetical protein